MANSIPKMLKAFALYVDGVGYAGTIEEMELPTLEITTETHRAGGMDAPVEIDMGMEPLVMSFTLAGYDAGVMAKVGTIGVNRYPLVARGSLREDGQTEVPVVVRMNGRIKKFEPGTWKAGDKSMPKYECALSYYKYDQDGQTLVEIDVLNMKRIIDGVDELEQTRTNLGI